MSKNEIKSGVIEHRLYAFISRGVLIVRVSQLINKEAIDKGDSEAALLKVGQVISKTLFVDQSKTLVESFLDKCTLHERYDFDHMTRVVIDGILPLLIPKKLKRTLAKAGGLEKYLQSIAPDEKEFANNCPYNYDDGELCDCQNGCDDAQSGECCSVCDGCNHYDCDCNCIR